MLCTMPDLLAGSDGYSMLVLLQIVKVLTVYYVYHTAWYVVYNARLVGRQ